MPLNGLIKGYVNAYVYFSVHKISIDSHFKLSL